MIVRTIDILASGFDVDPVTGCYLWNGPTNPGGYGQFSVHSKHFRVHRASWEEHNGPIPAGMFVCHKCDTPRCYRPDHLFLGTPKDNSLDMKAKGRSTAGDRNPARMYPERVARGSGHANSVLTESIVAEARALAASGQTIRSMATTYGVSEDVLGFAVRGRTWKHVNVPPVRKRKPLSAEVVSDARLRAASGERISDIAKSMGVDNNTLGYAIRGLTWKRVKTEPVVKEDLG